MESLQARDWEQQFENVLKSEVYEQFNMLLCNPSLSSAEQKQLLYNILFVDHTNPRHWHQYLTYLAEEYPHKKESLITLVFKALSVVPEAPNKDHPDFIRLHLRLAALDHAGQPVQARQRYRIMQKRKIGIRSAEYYVQYAQLEQEQRNFASAKQILERGVAAHAEPRHLLIHALDALKQEQQKAELAGGDDEATRPNSSVVVPSSQKPETRARSGDVPAVTPRARAVAAADSDDDNTRPLPAAVASTAAPSTPAPTPTPATATSAAATTTTATTDSAASVQRASSRLAARKRKEDEPTTTSRPIKRIGLLGTAKRVVAEAAPASPTIEFKPPRAAAAAAAAATAVAARATATEDKENADPLQTPARALKRTETFPVEKSFEMPQPRTLRKPVASSVKTPYSARSGVNDNTVALGKPGQTTQGSTKAAPSSPTIELKPAAQVDPKELKRKYIDDKLLQFDPEKLGKRRSTNSSSDASQCESKADGNASNSSIRSDDSQHSTASKRSGGGRPEGVNRSRGSEENTAAHGTAVASTTVADESVVHSDQSKHVSFMIEPLEQSTYVHSHLPSALRPFQSLLDADKILYVQGRPYLLLDLLGKGGSSKVYRVLATDGQTYAFKRVEMKGSDDVHALVESYSNEIKLLQRLKGNRHIIQLIDHEIDIDQMVVSMVMEIGEVDLAKVLHQHQKSSEQPKQHGTELSLNFIRLTWQQMLEAVQCIHDNRIVHGDLKPANFVFVKGQLKLIDFGIAKAISNDTTNIVRESQIGTVNYMAPEAIAPIMVDDADSDTPRMKLGRASDIWSMGCILYQMVYGRPPFANLNTIQKLHAIPNAKHKISYPDFPDSSVVACMKACLQRDPKDRPPIEGPGGLLAHPFLHPVTSAAGVAVAPTEPTATPVPAPAPAPATGQALSLAMVRSIVKLALASAAEVTEGKLDRLTLCEQIYSAISSGTELPTQQALRPSQQELQEAVAATPSQARRSRTKTRTPLRVLPVTIKEAINGPNQNPLKDTKTSDSQKWMRPKGSTPEKQDLRAVIERRLEEIRQYQEREDDTCVMSIDGWTIHEDP